MIDERSELASLRTAAKLIDSYRRTLIEARADNDLTDALGAITRYVFNLSDSQAAKILNGSRSGQISSERRLREAPRMASITLEDVERLVSDEKTPRAVLESVAVGRFQVPRGSLRSLGRIDQLREKLLTMARNERAHITIAEVAKDQR